MENIEAILNLDDKDKVDEITGTVTSVYDRTTGKGKKPPHRKWSVQNFMLEDDSGEVKVGAWNMDDLSELEGQRITLKRDMHFKDDGEYQSLEMGRNTKIIEEGAAEEKSPSRERKADSREKGKPARDKTSTGPDRNDRIYWQTCLKVSGEVFTGTSEIAAGAKGGLLEFARDLFAAQPGSPAQDKVRKMTTSEANEELDEARNKRTTRKAKPAPEPQTGGPEDQEPPEDPDDEDEMPF